MKFYKSFGGFGEELYPMVGRYIIQHSAPQNNRNDK
jgi:hypothetical protein